MSSARTSVKEKTDYSSLKRNGLIKKDTRCGRRAKHNVVVIIYNGLDILGVSVSGAQFFLLHPLFSPRSPFGDRFQFSLILSIIWTALPRIANIIVSAPGARPKRGKFTRRNGNRGFLYRHGVKIRLLGDEGYFDRVRLALLARLISS